MIPFAWSLKIRGNYYLVLYFEVLLLYLVMDKIVAVTWQWLPSEIIPRIISILAKSGFGVQILQFITSTINF